MPRPISYKEQPPAAPAVSPEELKKGKLKQVVLDHIGSPDDLICVDIRSLWDNDHYRVNIFREVKAMKKLTDSFFIHIVQDGMISCSPPLDRKYRQSEIDDLINRNVGVAQS